MNQNANRLYFVFRNNLIMLHRNLPGRTKTFVITIRLVLDILAAAQFIFKGAFHKFFKIVSAQAAYLKWVLFVKKENTGFKKSLNGFGAAYNGCILWDYYVKRKKTFTSLLKNNNIKSKNQL